MSHFWLIDNMLRKFWLIMKDFLFVYSVRRYICKNPSSSSRTGQNVVSKEMWCVSLRPAGIEIYEIHLVLIFLCTANFFWKITFSFVHFQFFTWGSQWKQNYLCCYYSGTKWKKRKFKAVYDRCVIYPFYSSFFF